MIIDETTIENYYNSLNSQSYVKDGIINLDDYLKAPVRILWILKEAHGSDKSASWDHRGFLGWGLLNNKRWKVTHAPIVRVSDAINKQQFEVDSIKHISAFTPDEIYSSMRSVAFINVKKTIGDSHSKYQDIASEYKVHKKALLAQIDLINPDVVINCSRVWELFCDLSQTEHIWEDDFGYSVNSERLVINSFHPQARYKHIESKILNIVKKELNKVSLKNNASI